MMKEEDVADVPIYAAFLDAPKNFVDGQGSIDRIQALCRAASTERNIASKDNK